MPDGMPAARKRQAVLQVPSEVPLLPEQVLPELFPPELPAAVLLPAEPVFLLL